MKIEWLTEKCESTDPHAIGLVEMKALELTDENKKRLLERSESFQKWIDAKWNPFVAEMPPGDELWRFRSSSETWEHLTGRTGYSIVRNGKIVRSLVTLLN